MLFFGFARSNLPKIKAVRHSIFLYLCAACALQSAELPVRDGLLMHFDGSAQAAAGAGAELPPIGNAQPVDLLLDASSNSFIATQPAPERRPSFVTDGASAYLNFDGKDDFIVVEPRRSAKEITIFVLAAPKENPGNFSALLGMNALGRNDYTSGLNFDFGPSPTKELSVLNVESAGATGFRDLLTPGFFNAAERPFGDFHVFTVRTRAGTNGVDVFLDGFKGGERPRSESRVAMDQFVIGGRIYSNDPAQPPFAQGHFKGAIAELLVYERALNDVERGAVEQSLLAKTVGLNGLLKGLKGHGLETVPDPPVVQMLVPGFTVRELPLKIGNLNNVRYRHDGKLVGQGYDGRIYLLSDTDGDGLEDKAEFFWEERTLRSPMGIALTAKGDPRGDGVFVASKGKVSLILDQDRDGRADEEIVIASGWPEPFHGVDCLGLAVDPKDGSIYFGRGCANFVEAYLIDTATGASRYRLDDERGTIQRISADFEEREIVCTGVRFTCGLAFNRQGDLFATDQEGATWLPNGNPLDELLHIEQGKHYGFPPRHPKHLPGVRDEPAVIEYGPQHQSTVGFFFNDGVNRGPHFGPAHWEGDAIVTGESRGKLYRTKLAKTPLGYVGQNQIIASLAMLAVDACVTPAGDLVVACHSGPPDWGTGPAGEGRIFKIQYSNWELPQPVLAWASAPDEFRIAFDRPLNPADWVDAQKNVKIEAGEHVRAGDRFEVIRPGYQVVRDQMASLRRWVEVLGLSLSEDRRELVLRVPRQTEPVTYSITLPLPEAWRASGGISQHPEMDLALTLNGVAGSVEFGATELRAVLPHPSLLAAAELTRGSARHELFLEAARKQGAELGLHTRVDLSNPFVPAVQSGSQLDWDPKNDPFASRKFSLRSDRAPNINLPGEASGNLQEVHLIGVPGSDANGNGLFLVSGNLKHRVAPEQLTLPWVLEGKVAGTNLASRVRTDVKGNWLRGRRVFLAEGGCATCHTVRGEGTPFGPDLSNLIFRDRESVLQDLIQPSATINPDHTGSMVTLADGTELAGLLRKAEGEKMELAMPAGARLDLSELAVKRIEPMKTSLMPAGIDLQLENEQLEDLLTFLLAEALEPAPITRTDPLPPPPRDIREVAEVLGEIRGDPDSTQLRVLLVAGAKDHGPDEHDYPLWLERWSRLLALAENVTVQTNMGFPSAEQLASADVAVFYNANPGWDMEKAALLDTFHERGGGAVYIHYAVDGGKFPDAAAERIGLAFTLGSRFRHGEFDLVFTKPHPITRGFGTLHFRDETYWNMRGDESQLNVIGAVVEEGAPRPELWTLERANARIVGCIPGHYTWTFDDPLFRALVLRSICWAAKMEQVDRLSELSTVGARVRR